MTKTFEKYIDEHKKLCVVKNQEFIVDQRFDKTKKIRNMIRYKEKVMFFEQKINIEK